MFLFKNLPFIDSFNVKSPVVRQILCVLCGTAFVCTFFSAIATFPCAAEDAADDADLSRLNPIEEKNDIIDGSVKSGQDMATSSPAAVPASTREIIDQLNELQNELNNLKEQVSGKRTRLFLNLPEKLYALVGEELNVYFDNLVDGHDFDYDFNVDCRIGMQLERCFRVVPTEAGTYPIFITVTDKNGNSLVRKSTIYVADPSAGAGKERSLIIIGDSTTNNGMCVVRLNSNFAEDPMDVHTIGTRGSGKNMHEGRSGWTFKACFTVDQDPNFPDVFNPFLNPETKTFDASYYFSKTNVAKPDWVFINLGINDAFSFKDDESLKKAIPEINSRCDEMIRSIQAASPETKIGIALTIPPNYSQDAFGKAYGNGQTRKRCKRNNVIWVSNLLSRYENRENERIYVIPIHTNLDTRYNMGMEETPYNKRNPETYSSPIPNSGVHPVKEGYWQIADVYWFFLKAFEHFSETGIPEK